MAVRSRKLTKNTVPREGIKIEDILTQGCYCRRCRKTLPADSFFSATDLILDTNSKMSICRMCIDELYERFLLTEHTRERTILRLCRTLNVSYSDRAIDTMDKKFKTLAETGRETNKVFGYYLAALKTTRTGNILDGGEGSDLTFIEPPRQGSDIFTDISVPTQDKSYYEKEWGKGLDLDDYEFLDSELQEYFKTSKHDSHNEVILLKEICFIQNEIRKARLEGGSVTSLQKSLQEYMKGCNLTPASQSQVSSSQSVESFGVWLKEIEQTEPAEWFDEQEKFRDMDGFQEDLDDIKRSIGKFILGSRDFRLDDLEDISGIENDSEEESIITESTDADSS